MERLPGRTVMLPKAKLQKSPAYISHINPLRFLPFYVLFCFYPPAHLPRKALSCIMFPLPKWRNGRRRGLKIPRSLTVRVRVPFSAPQRTLPVCGRVFSCFFLSFLYFISPYFFFVFPAPSLSAAERKTLETVRQSVYTESSEQFHTPTGGNLSCFCILSATAIPATTRIP